MQRSGVRSSFGPPSTLLENQILCNRNPIFAVRQVYASCRRSNPLIFAPLLCATSVVPQIPLARQGFDHGPTPAHFGKVMLPVQEKSRCSSATGTDKQKGRPNRAIAAKLLVTALTIAFELHIPWMAWRETDYPGRRSTENRNGNSAWQLPCKRA